jgi:hypothetical protein
MAVSLLVGWRSRLQFKSEAQVALVPVPFQ